MQAGQPTAEHSITMLEQAETGEHPSAAMCREHSSAEHTFTQRVPSWRTAYGGMSVNEAQRLRHLEKENGRLKRLLAERLLEIDLLKELLGKKG